MYKQSVALAVPEITPIRVLIIIIVIIIINS